MFINPKTDSVMEEGEIYRSDAYCNTLEKIAKNGAEEFYNGETAEKLISDLSGAGGIMTLDDLRNYK